MLLNFNFSNFRSFKDKVEFSMEPLTNNGSVENAIETGYKKSPYVYRTSAIFGANASGKSNFIQSMEFIRLLMGISYMSSLENIIIELPIYKLSNQNTKALFECEFIKNDIVYRYIVELTDNEIIREEAYYIELEKDKREKCIFKRDKNGFNSPLGLSKELAQQTISSRLIISDWINNKNVKNEHLLNIYRWFTEDVSMIEHRHHQYWPDEPCVKKQDIQKKIAFLQKADINISRIFKNNKGELLYTQIDEVGNEVSFNFEENASDGTQTLYKLSDYIIDVLQEGKILFIDELDNSLHPHLVKYLVNLFNNPETNPKGAQLIFTSHAHYLMDGDTLTRDQIWFVSKENGYSSDLYSLSDFKAIKRKKGAFYNEYMYGIFGAVPKISEE